MVMMIKLTIDDENKIAADSPEKATESDYQQVS